MDAQSQQLPISSWATLRYSVQRTTDAFFSFFLDVGGWNYSSSTLYSFSTLHTPR